MDDEDSGAGSGCEEWDSDEVAVRDPGETNQERMNYDEYGLRR